MFRMSWPRNRTQATWGKMPRKSSIVDLSEFRSNKIFAENSLAINHHIKYVIENTVGNYLKQTIFNISPKFFPLFLSCEDN